MKKLILLFLSLQIQAGFFSKVMHDFSTGFFSKDRWHVFSIGLIADMLYTAATLRDKEASALEKIDILPLGEKIDPAKKDYYKVVGNIVPELIQKEAEKKLGTDRASKLNVIIGCNRSSMGVYVDNKSRDYLFIPPREFETIVANNDQKKVNQARAGLQHEFTHLKENHCPGSILGYPYFYFNISALGLYELHSFARPIKSRLLHVVSLFLVGSSSVLITYPLMNTLRGSKSHEWQADEGIENDTAVLQGAIDYFKESQQEWNQLPLRTKIGLSIKDANCHPSNEARIARFEERLALLKQ